jgi:predicted DNA-binding helix-hairpin-helix protein
VKPPKWGLRLNHDVTTSERSVPTPKFLKIDTRLRGSIRLRVVPYTHSQLIKVLKHLHTYDRDVGCSLRGFEAQP